MSDQMEQVAALVSRSEEERFYGTLELKFECGRIVLVRRSETIKLNNSAAGGVAAQAGDAQTKTRLPFYSQELKR